MYVGSNFWNCISTLFFTEPTSLTIALGFSFLAMVISMSWYELRGAAIITMSALLTAIARELCMCVFIFFELLLMKIFFKLDRAALDLSYRCRCAHTLFFIMASASDPPINPTPMIAMELTTT